MPNGEQQQYQIKLGGQTYQFMADPGLSQDAAIDYANKKYPKFAEAYKQRFPGASKVAPGVSHFPGTDIPRSPSRIPASMTGHPEEGLQKRDIPEHAIMAGSTLGGGMFEAVPGVAGILARMLGSGTGAAIGQVGGKVAAGEKPSAKEALKTGAMTAALEPIAEVARIPGITKRVGAKIGAAEKAAEGSTVYTRGVTDKVNRALELTERGHGSSLAVNKLNEMIGDSPPRSSLSFQEARDSYSALTDEMATTKGKMLSALGNVKDELGERIIESAERLGPGKGKQFRQLLKSYGQATSVTAKAKVALDIAWKAALWGAVGGAVGGAVYKTMKTQ